MTNKKLAKTLLGAASALGHGRFTTARKKVAEVYEELHGKDRELVVVLEGGLCQELFTINEHGDATGGGPEYTVLDWDQFKQDTDEDIAERWSRYPERVRQYIEKHLSDEFSQFQEAIQRASAPKPDEHHTEQSAELVRLLRTLPAALKFPAIEEALTTEEKEHFGESWFNIDKEPT